MGTSDNADYAQLRIIGVILRVFLDPSGGAWVSEGSGDLGDNGSVEHVGLTRSTHSVETLPDLAGHDWSSLGWLRFTSVFRHFISIRSCWFDVS